MTPQDHAELNGIVAEVSITHHHVHTTMYTRHHTHHHVHHHTHTYTLSLFSLLSHPPALGVRCVGQYLRTQGMQATLQQFAAECQALDRPIESSLALTPLQGAHHARITEVRDGV
jgi:hypothetical protein